MNQFDKHAATWDFDAMRKERTQAVANAIIDKVPLQKEWSAFEFGPGTGTLSFILKEVVGEISMADNSAEMVNEMTKKVKEANEPSLKPILLDLEKEDFVEKSFDLIFSAMAIHHVHDIDFIIKKFHAMLSKGGYVAIADLFAEDGSFHGSGFDGHNGFDPDVLGKQFLDAGFSTYSFKECYIIHKQTESGEWKDFPIFLLVVQK